jgi:hypothetical protein
MYGRGCTKVRGFDPKQGAYDTSARRVAWFMKRSRWIRRRRRPIRMLGRHNTVCRAQYIRAVRKGGPKDTEGHSWGERMD